MLNIDDNLVTQHTEKYLNKLYLFNFMKSHVIRISEKTNKLLQSFNKGSIDAAIKFLWRKISIQGRELNQWRNISKCPDVKQFAKLLEKLSDDKNIGGSKMNAVFNTRIFKTQSGAFVRVDEKPCRMLIRSGPHIGEKCNLQKKIIFFKFKAFDGKIRKAVCLTCDHQAEELEISGDDIHWNEEMLIVLFDLVNSGKTMREIHENLKIKFPDKVFKIEPCKKEFRCSAKRKYWKATASDCGEVWSYSVSRNEAEDTIYFAEKYFEKSPFRKKEQIDDSICKLCGHEMYWHKRGQCEECKSFCAGNEESPLPATNQVNDEKQNQPENDKIGHANE